MKKLQNNFTTPDQSKRLLELGVPVNSADCYLDITNGRRGMLAINGIYGIDIPNILCEDGSQRFIHCWSVGRLMEIFLLCTPYKEISVHSENLIEQMIESIFMVHKDGLIDFSRLED